MGADRTFWTRGEEVLGCEVPSPMLLYSKKKILNKHLEQSGIGKKSDVGSLDGQLGEGGAGRTYHSFCRD